MSNIILIGPSSSGKSTAISRLYTNDFAKEKANIIYAYEFDAEPYPVIQANSIFHINMFHVWGNNPDRLDAPISSSPVISEIIRQKITRKAVVLVISQSELLERIITRTYINDGQSANFQLYPKQDFINFVDKAPIHKIYARWIEFLSSYNFDIEYISSSDYNYRQINSSDEVLEIVSR
jgi:GTPase SAR1 family protein